MIFVSRQLCRSHKSRLWYPGPTEKCRANWCNYLISPTGNGWFLLFGYIVWYTAAFETRELRRDDGSCERQFSATWQTSIKRRPWTTGGVNNTQFNKLRRSWRTRKSNIWLGCRLSSKARHARVQLSRLLFCRHRCINRIWQLWLLDQWSSDSQRLVICSFRTKVSLLARDITRESPS